MQPTDDTPFSKSAPGARAGQDAAQWLATLSDEHCMDAEREQFFQWLRSSTLHVDEFLRVSALAKHASSHQAWPDDSIDALIEAARASANVAQLDHCRDGPRDGVQKKSPRWGLAASLLAVLAIGALVTTLPDVRDYLDSGYRTAVGEQRSITLEDGSVVELNSQSHLRAHYSPALRAVELTQGEAIFHVAADANRPFRVRTGATDIVAVGTAFNVNARDDRTIVTVLEGRVRVNSRDKDAAKRAGRGARVIESFELSTGEQLIVAPQLPAVRVALEDTANVTSWTERRLIFENTSIVDAAREFARYSPRHIHIEDPQLAERRITGVFDATDPASLVEFLGTDETVDVRVDGSGWRVSLERPGQ